MIPDFGTLQTEISGIYESLRRVGGHVADYIPQLGRVDPEKFGIALCTIDGQRFAVGDADTLFCAQSVCKPVNYGLTLEEHGADVVHRHVGREPSGRGFNELTLNSDGLPHNPMINSGAIMSCSLIRPQQDTADRFDYVAETWRRLSGGGTVWLHQRSPSFRTPRRGPELRARLLHAGARFLPRGHRSGGDTGVLLPVLLDRGRRAVPVGGGGVAGMHGITGTSLTGTIPVFAFATLQMMSAVITPALIGGSIADRAEFGAWMLFITLWVTLVYFPVAHWVWQAADWIFKLGIVDFAGGTAVHINACMAALGALLVHRNRLHTGESPPAASPPSGVLLPTDMTGPYTRERQHVRHMTFEGNDRLTPGAHELTIDGVRQRYHVAGRGPVCLVHPGGPGSHWGYMRMPLVERHMTTVYVAPVGAGESGELPDGQYSTARFARFVDGLVGHLAVPEIYFLGHSAGSFAGLQYELDHPGKLAGLILYGGAPVFGPDLYSEADTQISAFEKRHADQPGMPDVVDAYRSRLPRANKAELMAYMGRLLPAYFADYWSREEELREWSQAVEIEYAPAKYRGNWDVRNELTKVSVPTQILVGRHDWICPVRWSEEMHEKIPGSRLTVFEHSGHFQHVEEAEKFAATIADFLADTSATE